MRIVVAHNLYSSAQPSGENTVLATETAALRAAGVEVVEFLRSSDEIADLPLGRKLALPVSPIYARQAQKDLSALLVREKPDVFHLHNPYPLLSPWVIRTAHKHGVPVVHTVHNYRQVCASALYFRDGHICHDCRGRAFPLPAVVHSCYRGSKAQSLVMATTLTVHRGTWRSVDRYIALTPMIAEHLASFGVPAERITVKPNSVPDPGFSDTPGEGFVIVGRLSEEKGLPLLLEAWRKHPVGALGPLRIVGDGPLRPLAEQAAAERADIEFVGPVDRAGVNRAMRAAAALIVASTWHDVLPTVVIEALAVGRPVLGTNLGGIPYEIGDAGWVVEPDAAAMAEALGTAAKEAAGLRRTARDRYETTFTPEIITSRLVDVYREVSAR